MGYVWDDRTDAEIILRIYHMSKRVIEALEGEGGYPARFAKNEPTSILEAIKVLKERHG